MVRGFSLIEAMVAVAITGIIASLAVPNMLPILHRAELGGATDNVLGFVSRGRVQAFADRRCVQMVVLKRVAGERQKLVLRELNTFDCDGTSAHDQDIESAPRLSANATLWTVIDTLDLETTNVTVSFVNHPKTLENVEGGQFGTLPAPGYDAVPQQELRFRGNGRIWSPDDNATDDDVTIVLSHDRSGDTKRFRIAGNGVVVDRPGGT